MTWTSFLMSWPACSVRTAISIRPMMMSETQAMATTAPMSILIMTSQAHLVFMSTMSVAVELTQRTSSRLFPSETQIWSIQHEGYNRAIIKHLKPVPQGQEQHKVYQHLQQQVP